MGILIVTDGLCAEFVVECILCWEARLDEGVLWLYVVVWVDLLPEKEIELMARRVGELGKEKPELLHPARPKFLADFLERRTEELQTVL